MGQRRLGALVHRGESLDLRGSSGLRGRAGIRRLPPLLRWLKRSETPHQYEKRPVHIPDSLSPPENHGDAILGTS